MDYDGMQSRSGPNLRSIEILIKGVQMVGHVRTHFTIPWIRLRQKTVRQYQGK